MASSAVFASVDVALWFTERARRDDSYLQPQKLQCLLYLAQGSYAAAYHGRRLMPAVFVIEEKGGPCEPNIAVLFAKGRPEGFRLGRISPEVEMFLNDVWRSYGAYRNEVLSERVCRHDVVVQAQEKGVGEEISFDVLSSYFSQIKESSGKTVKKKEDESVVRTADGRVLPKWRPREVGKNGIAD